MTDFYKRLTALAHGGGCGCKLAPAGLQEILAKTPATRGHANLIVGAETGDGAAIYRLNDQQALVATTDFFMPIVDDPFAFGRIAAIKCDLGRLCHGRVPDSGTRRRRNAAR